MRRPVIDHGISSSCGLCNARTSTVMLDITSRSMKSEGGVYLRDALDCAR